MAAVGAGDEEHVHVVGAVVAAGRSGSCECLLVGVPRQLGELVEEAVAAVEVHLHAWVVQQVLPDACQVHDGLDAEGPQMLDRPDPGTQQQCRRVVGAAGHHDAVRPDELFAVPTTRRRTAGP